MSIWRIGFLALASAGAAHGIDIIGTQKAPPPDPGIVAQNINYSVNFGQTTLTNTTSTVFTVNTGGWSGSGTVSTNDGAGTGFTFPITLDLSSLDLTCSGTCSQLNLGFGGSWTFFTLPAGLPGGDLTPYSVSLTGTGPALSGFFDVEAGTNGAGGPISESVGDYNFATSGLVTGGNTTVSLGGFLTVPAMNGSSEELVLPDSFRLQVGVASTPEPASFALASAGLLAGFASWRWRRRGTRRSA